MFKCHWGESNHGVKEDKLGFTFGNLNRIGHKDDRFILATQAKQVFYIKDPTPQRWSIAPSTEHRDKINNDDDGRDQVKFDELHTSIKELGDVEEFEDVEANIKLYVRKHGDGVWIDNAKFKTNPFMYVF